MKIKYTERRIKNNLGYGILMIGVGVFAVYSDSLSAFSYLWIVFGALQAGTALYEREYQYLSIKGKSLTKHSLIPKTIEIGEIEKVRHFVDSYEIVTAERTLTIDKGIIETESLFQLQDFFSSLKLKV